MLLCALILDWEELVKTNEMRNMKLDTQDLVSVVSGTTFSMDTAELVSCKGNRIHFTSFSKRPTDIKTS